MKAKRSILVGLMAKNETEVYAIHGADPEALAYAMAKYSRSALSLKESLKEISSQKAEEFLNTFYFQYGHRSIADLAHVAFAIEKLSLLAAISLVDEQRWDGQERSTRYQNFRKSGWFTPAFEAKDEAVFTDAVSSLFEAYEGVGAGMLEELKAHTALPDGMEEAAYTRTLKARAFDMARYLLPLATNTSLGQITNARTLEGQISRLLGSEFAEIRALGGRLKEAASGGAWDVSHAGAAGLIEEIAAADAALGERAKEAWLREVKVSPTLVKYTAASEFAKKSAEELTQAVSELMRGAAIVQTPAVDLVETTVGERFSLEIDLATSLLYSHCHYGYRQLRAAVTSLSAAGIEELIALGTRHRGRHDELPRAFSAAQGFRFDVLMDVGGFRDMHRHRRCTQLLQPYTDVHGYEMPDFPGQPAVTGSRVAGAFTEAMEKAFAAYRALGGHVAGEVSGDASPLPAPDAVEKIPFDPSLQRASVVSAGTAPGGRGGSIFGSSQRTAHSPAAVPVPQFGQDGSVRMHWGTPLPVKARAEAAYVLPLATRCRALFTMDYAEAVYISELRSAPAGHWSYRRVAWEMYQAVARAHPALGLNVRIENVYAPVDLLKR